MKKFIIAAIAGLVLTACGGEPEMTAAQEYQLKVMQMQQQHELNMARAQQAPVQQYAAPQQQEYYSEPVQPAQQSYESSAAYGNQPSSSGESDSGIGSTLLAVGGGMLAGYAISELLDDGYRSYSDKSGRTVYVDKNGRQIDKRDYDAYKTKHPTKHALSSYNQKGKQAVGTAKTATVNTASTAKTKTVEAAKKVDKKVVQPAKAKVKTYSRPSTSSKRR